MKTTFAVMLCVLLLLFSACAQKVNDPADVQAIKDLLARLDKAFVAGDAEAAASGYYADNAIRMDANRPASAGKAAIKETFKSYIAQAAWTGLDTAEDVHVSGNLAVVRGSYNEKIKAKTADITQTGKGKWIAAFERQTDGTWKCIFDCINSDLPVTEAVPLGEDEIALEKIEQDWAAASAKNDWATLDKILATEYANNADGLITPKKQFIANMKSGAYKVASLDAGEMKALVIGKTAIVHGLGMEKSTLNGKDTSGTYRYTDVFVKRDGRWQAVSTYATKEK